MFRSIWQLVRGLYSQRRSGIDKGNIEHLRADLRFRLAMVEYAYYGKSGKRVARCLAELKSVLGERAVHRYLRSLDPDLRTQFVERFQGARRNYLEELEVDSAARSAGPGRAATTASAGPLATHANLQKPVASNVVPIGYAAR